MKIRKLGLVAYEPTWRAMQAFNAARDASTEDQLWLVEHPPVFTLGLAGRREHVLDPGPIPVVATDRGGQVTYHGPGQLVGYPITLLDPTPDIWRFVGRVEQALVDVAAAFGLEARGERGDLTGVWVGDAKLGAIGMRVSRGVTSHGFALNCATDLAYFNAIVPCGMPDRTACSLSSLLGHEVPVADVLPAVERRLAERLDRSLVAVDPATLDLPAEDYDPETVHA